MAEVDDFLAAVLPRMIEIDTALHNGDAEPRKAIWSHEDPVTLFGAVLTNVGWGEIGPAFDALASSFSDCESFEVEVVAAEAKGDFGYIVAIEHTTASVGGKSPEPYKLRVTTIYRREDGEWRIVHRHGDPVSDSAGAHSQMQRMSDELQQR
jgi:ketosteroid isomerase-like protein